MGGGGVVEFGRGCIRDRGLWSLGVDVSEIGGCGVWEGMYPRSGVVEFGRECIRDRGCIRVRGLWRLGEAVSASVYAPVPYLHLYIRQQTVIFFECETSNKAYPHLY